MSIRTNQQLTRLRKITVISGITLRAHFLLGIVKFDTLYNLLLTLDIIKDMFLDKKTCMFLACHLQMQLVY